MANYVQNLAKGRACEFAYRVKNNDPANSALILVVLSTSDTEANMQDVDDLTSFLAGTPNEAGAAWGRKTLTDTELSTVAPDDVNNRFPLTLPSVTWTAVAASNNSTGLLVCYDSDTTSGTDSNVIVICHCDFAVTTDGNDVVLNSGDALRAS